MSIRSRTCMKRRGTFSGKKTAQIIRQLNSASPVENQCVSVDCFSYLRARSGRDRAEIGGRGRGGAFERRVGLVLAARLDRDEDVRLATILGRHVLGLPHDDAQLELLLLGWRERLHGALRHRIGLGEAVRVDLDLGRFDRGGGGSRSEMGGDQRRSCEISTLTMTLPCTLDEVGVKSWRSSRGSLPSCWISFHVFE